ncbi:MAG: DUF1622 domain-containing protein [Candidatus Bathyarchaeia archaeon]
MEKSKIMPIICALIIILVVSVVSFFLGDNWFHSVGVNMIVVFLEVAINFLYLLSTGLILLGSILMAIRYIYIKFHAPLEPAKFELHARYLTVGLEILIGAEIINTAITRTFDGFLVLTFTIITRGLIAFILHMEEKWVSK